MGGILKKSFFLFYIIFTLFILNHSLYAEGNPFLNTAPNEKQSKNVKKTEQKEEKVEIRSQSSFFKTISKWQRKIRSSIEEKLLALSENNKFSLFMMICLIAFLYGIIHALGPGHGKGIITGWILSSEKKLKTVLFTGSGAAMLHGFSAVALVLGAWLIIKNAFTTDVNTIAIYLQWIAAVLIILFGLYLLIGFLLTKLKLIKHEHHHHKIFEGKLKPGYVVLSIGLIPCPITVLFLVFCISFKMIWQGIIFVLFFSLGMAFTLIAISLIIWFTHKKLGNLKAKWIKFLTRNLMPLLAALFLLLAGFFTIPL